ncbi:hypothetical protein ACTXL6_03580 [Brachybacterium tyrofermentans]|uniref:hypothetical protein n=1 Tax=Brachybacterium tyrofermentans TaxID=47848 RepID=UPI003FD18D2B
MTDTALPPLDLNLFPPAWLVAMLAWDHDCHAHLPHRISPAGIPLAPNGHPAVLLAVVRALGDPSPLDVTADDLAAAAEGADLTVTQHAELPAALASFTAWACPRGVLDGDPLPAPTDAAPLRLVHPDATPHQAPAASTAPDYLTAAEAEHDHLTRDPDAHPLAILDAEDRLRAAQADARANGDHDHPEH